ncbi:hypothetical protein [Natrarchaeobaculum aegyptiacum]|uniref:Uncharacterized protein n=1 Tax=Natrarchaeobaculum aegyptiacum TaxID=745377 RepID=A0A2Z2HRV1_9EURY|nr:hypothetical protein [Natrarchaeobaculum aegyptiacum]ARS89916.1 hypothetical protein B1756_09370 [Natrarchaeobaculum aegyptiacum]
MPVLVFAIAVALSISAFQLSGVADELGHSPETDIDEQFDTAAEETTDGEFDPDEGGGDSLLGSTIQAVNTVTSIGSVLIYLPSTLEALGFPGWFATLFGRVSQLILALGFAQLIRGFVIQ